MITTGASDNIVLYETTAVTGVTKYLNPTILVQATMYGDDGADIVLTAIDSNDTPLGSYSLRLRSSELNAETMTGTGNSEEIWSVFELASVTYLESLATNTGATFTIV